MQTRRRRTHRPRSHTEFMEARKRSMMDFESMPVEWVEEVVEGPDVESRKTLLTLAKMTFNAYVRLKSLDVLRVF